MAKLLCVANWSDTSIPHPDYPILFELKLSSAPSATGFDTTDEWLNCTANISIQRQFDSPVETIISTDATILTRDVQRLARDLNEMLTTSSSSSMTFVPVVPSFELWLTNLNDDVYRIIIWQDMAAQFDDTTSVSYQGIRFTSNRTRLMGFLRGLQAEIKSLLQS